MTQAEELSATAFGIVREVAVRIGLDTHRQLVSQSSAWPPLQRDLGRMRNEMDSTNSIHGHGPYAPYEPLANDEVYREPWMSDDQWECSAMIADLFRGWHHVNGTIKPFGNGIEHNTRMTNWCHTYDYDGLTRAVIMAHDRCIRFAVGPSGPGMLKLMLHKRHKREGKLCERHPTIEEAVQTHHDPDYKATSLQRDLDG